MVYGLLSGQPSCSFCLNFPAFAPQRMWFTTFACGASLCPRTYPTRNPAEIHLFSMKFPWLLLLGVMSPSSETPVCKYVSSIIVEMPHIISLFVRFSFSPQAETVLLKSY